MFQELCSRTIVLRYITTEAWWWFWSTSVIQDWPYIITRLAVLEDVILDAKFRYGLRGEVHLEDSNGTKITHEDQLKRYETYLIVVE